MSHLHKWVKTAEEDGFRISIEIEHTHDDCTCDTSQAGLKEMIYRKALWGLFTKVS